MSIINNYITKLFSNDKNKSFAILSYLDFENEFTYEDILNYTNNIINNNPILKQDIIRQDNTFFLKDIENFDINNHFSIKYTNKVNFNSYIKYVLNNKNFSDIFYLLYCVDKINKTSRIYVKIDHSYVDGYRLCNMLMIKPICKNYTVPEFKRKTSFFKTIYHYIIGTIVLLVMNIKILLKIIFNNKTENNNKEVDTDFIICKPFMLDKIKNFASNNNITINDFLYSLMIKTDRLYTNKNRNIQTVSPINVSKIEYTNNWCPLLHSINNSFENKTLLQQVHNTFDNIKYSLFIPFLLFIINIIFQYVNIDIISCLGR